MKRLVTTLLRPFVLVAAVAGCASAPAAAPPMVVVNAPATGALAANAALPTPPAVTPTPAPYPPPNPTPQQTMAPRPTGPPLPTLTPTPTRTPLPPTPPADSADIAAIQAVIERSYRLQGIAARSFDTSQFDTVYINDPRTPLDKGQASLIEDYRTLVHNRMPQISDPPGILDFWRTEYTLWQIGAERWEQQRQGAKLNAADGPIGPPPRIDPPRGDTIRYEGIWVTGDRAEALADNGPALRRLYLLRMPDGWRISGERVLDVHW